MHGQITHETRTLYRSRCACGWKSEESEHQEVVNLAYDEHIADVRSDEPEATPSRPVTPDRPAVVDLMAALEASLAAVKRDRANG